MRCGTCRAEPRHPERRDGVNVHWALLDHGRGYAQPLRTAVGCRAEKCVSRLEPRELLACEDDLCRGVNGSWIVRRIAMVANQENGECLGMRRLNELELRIDGRAARSGNGHGDVRSHAQRPC